MKSKKFHCLVFRTKYIFKVMEMMDQLLVARVNYKKNSYLNNYSKKLFCRANCFNFQSNQDSYIVNQTF